MGLLHAEFHIWLSFGTAHRSDFQDSTVREADGGIKPV
jgi:hypothetical protein